MQRPWGTPQTEFRLRDRDCEPVRPWNWKRYARQAGGNGHGQVAVAVFRVLHGQRQLPVNHADGGQRMGVAQRVFLKAIEAFTAWLMASMPVMAVMKGGMVNVIRESSTEMSGSRK